MFEASILSNIAYILTESIFERPTSIEINLKQGPILQIEKLKKLTSLS